MRRGGRVLELLDDENPHVRLRAGFDALYFSPEDGLRVLRALADEAEGSASIDASMTLWVRERGDLVLFPWEGDGDGEREP